MLQKWAIRALPAGSDVAVRIEGVYPTLSPALREFADFVLSQPMKVVQLSINDSVHASGVSVATANRFARKLGFDGYPQFRAEIVRAFEDVLAPVERLKRQVSDGTSPTEILAASFEEDMDNLKHTVTCLDMQRVQWLAERLAGADRVFAVGFDNSAALASIFAHRLVTAGMDVRTTQIGGGRLAAARELARLQPEDLVIAIAFPRYIRDTVELAREAARHGQQVVAITDSPASPLVEVSEIAIYLQARRTIGSTSDTAILGFLEALAAAAISLRPGAAEASETFADFAMPWVVSKTRES